MERHIRIVRILYIALGVFGALVSLMLFIAVAFGEPTMREWYPIGVTNVLMATIIGLLSLISALSLIGGAGLLQRRSWARPLVIALSILNLFSFPLGTVVGICALWAMLKPETRELLAAPRPGAWAH